LTKEDKQHICGETKTKYNRDTIAEKTIRMYQKAVNLDLTMSGFFAPFRKTV